MFKNLTLTLAFVISLASNASKGSKSLSIWLNSNYCQSKNITTESVADIIRAQEVKTTRLQSI